MQCKVLRMPLLNSVCGPRIAWYRYPTQTDFGFITRVSSARNPLIARHTLLSGGQMEEPQARSRLLGQELTHGLESEDVQHQLTGLTVLIADKFSLIDATKTARFHPQVGTAWAYRRSLD